MVLGAKSDIAAATARLYAEKSCALTLAARETISLEKIKEDLLIRGAVNVELAEVNLESVKSIKTFLKNLGPLPDLVICAVGYLGEQS
ncbi:MAG: short-chain dehydrogenase, partial [SAR324 cluster bacterium]|nr:short-chain dehydrogenase [SAR324 cluster bacterium]